MTGGGAADVLGDGDGEHGTCTVMSQMTGNINDTFAKLGLIVRVAHPLHHLDCISFGILPVVVKWIPIPIGYNGCGRDGSA
jgi:hypothetical protein